MADLRLSAVAQTFPLGAAWMEVSTVEPYGDEFIVTGHLTLTRK